MAVKRIAYRLINEALLKPLSLKLSFRIGDDPVEDIARLLGARSISTVIDGGAYKGSFSRSMAIAFPMAKIHAFEPTPFSFDLLVRNLSDLPLANAYCLALGREAGKVEFSCNSSALTNSVRASTAAGSKYFGKLVGEEHRIDVQVIALGNFAIENGIDGFDVIKLDLQGNERDAIIGAGNLRGSIQAALIEVQFVQLYEGAPRFAEIESLMRESGLSLYQFYELVRSPRDGRLLYGDALFIRDEVLSVSSGGQSQ